jgi:hypothetical protein
MGGETSDGGNFALPYAGLGPVAIARGAAYKAAASQSRDDWGRYVRTIARVKPTLCGQKEAAAGRAISDKSRSRH